MYSWHSLCSTSVSVTQFPAKVLRGLVESCACLRRRGARCIATAGVAGLLYLASLTRTKAEDRADYHYEDYAEDNNRIHVTTQDVYFDLGLKSWVSLAGNFVYDAISGATPTGAPPLSGQTEVAKVHMHDRRYAGFLEPTIKVANHSLTPQFSYSQESDYRSIGVSLGDAIDFNEKNTTLALGVSHNFDEVQPNEGEFYLLGTPITKPLHKDDTDVLVGLSQLLGPNTIVSGDVTLGYSDGYLSDPYRRVLFDDVPYTPGTPFTVWPENRPDHKFKQIAFLSLQQYFDPLNGALELDYRFYHDTFEVTAHTVTVQWNQKLGKRVIISPLFRYYTQTAAFFYATHFPGDPDNQQSFPLPGYYSSDYRLSALDTFTYGVELSVKIQEHLSLQFGYRRYIMQGRDNVTAADAYPKANIFSGGLTLWF